MAHDVELVIDDLRLRCIILDRVAERLPHVHRRQFDVGALFFAQSREKQVDVDLFASFTSDPNRTPALQVTNDDPVVMSLTDRDLIDTDTRGAGSPVKSTCFCM